MGLVLAPVDVNLKCKTANVVDILLLLQLLSLTSIG